MVSFYIQSARTNAMRMNFRRTLSCVPFWSIRFRILENREEMDSLVIVELLSGTFECRVGQSLKEIQINLI